MSGTTAVRRCSNTAMEFLPSPFCPCGAARENPDGSWRGAIGMEGQAGLRTSEARERDTGERTTACLVDRPVVCWAGKRKRYMPRSRLTQPKPPTHVYLPPWLG